MEGQGQRNRIYYSYMLADDSLRSKAVEIINDYFGKPTSDLYANLYKRIDDKSVYESIKEILMDYVGDIKSNEILELKGIKIS
jgi:hypothetical protein